MCFQRESNALSAGDTIPLQSFLDLGSGSDVVGFVPPCLTALGMHRDQHSHMSKKGKQAAAQVLHETVGPINSFHLQDPTTRNILLVGCHRPLLQY